MKNKIFAIEAAPDAMPPKPNTAAIMATTKNITVQRNISLNFKGYKLFFLRTMSKKYLENTVPSILNGCCAYNWNNSCKFLHIIKIL